MAIKEVILIGLLIISCVVPVEAFVEGFPHFQEGFALGADPDGFRGIKWGTDIASIRDMELIQNGSRDTREKRYKKIGDVLRIGSAQIDKIEYQFINGKFYAVNGDFIGLDNWEKIREIFFYVFGAQQIEKPKGGLRFFEIYNWYGELVFVTLSFGSPINNRGYFYIGTLPKGAFQRAKEFYKKKREKEGF